MVQPNLKEFIVRIAVIRLLGAQKFVNATNLASLFFSLVVSSNKVQTVKLSLVISKIYSLLT